jgi:hypothetical protein
MLHRDDNVLGKALQGDNTATVETIAVLHMKALISSL